ncbi:MAG: hypothetical protein ACLFQV_06845 [Vulcanimicrobiota bacterium]
MAICPLLAEECLREKCEWWAAGLKQCTVVTNTILLERIHDMGAYTYSEYVAPPVEE